MGSIVKPCHNALKVIHLETKDVCLISHFKDVLENPKFYHE